MQREKKFTKTQQKAFLQQAYPNGHFYAETPTDTSMQKLQRVSAGSIPCNHLL